MPRSLPPRPSLHHLQQEAKNLLKAHKAGDASCCGVLRRLKQFESKSDAAILAGHVSLVEVQYALAMEYGFESWAALREHVEAARRALMIAEAAAQRGRKFLADAVDRIHRFIDGQDWAGSGEMRHMLFSMRAAGWDTDFPTVMCVSGVGLMFHYEPQNWHVAYYTPGDWLDRIVQATGFGYEELAHESAEDVWGHVVQTVDTGRVIDANWMEWVTFAGYQDAQDPDGRMVFALDPIFEWPGGWWDWAKFCKWYEEWCKPFGGLRRYSGKVAILAPRDSAIATLRQIPSFAREERPPEKLSRARYGLAGIAAYADDVADVSKPKDYLAGPWKGCHAIIPQWQARRHSAVYLRRVSLLFEADAKALLLKAADEYQAAHAAWQEFHNHLGNDSPNKNWDSADNRQAGSAAVRRALKHETAAVEQVEKALAAMQ